MALEMGNSKLVNNIYLLLPPYTSSIKKSSIADTGALGHYFQADSPHVIALRPTSPIRVKQPNGKMLQSTKGCQLTL